MSDGTSAYVGGDSEGGWGKTHHPEESAERLEAGMLLDGSFPGILADVSSYIAALNAASPHLASDVFSPCIAWSNRVFLGIRAFGPSTDGPACVVWKYWGYHQMLLINFVLAMVPVLYVAGFSLATALLISLLMMAPMTLSTPFPESAIFGSPFVNLCIERGGKRIADLRRGTSFFSLFFFLFTSVMFTALPLSPSFFWAYPWALERGDQVTQALILAAGFVTIPVQSINYGFQVWQPLAEMHQMEVLNATKQCADAVQALLFDKSLAPEDARVELARLTRKLVKPLQKELKIWGSHIFCVIAWTPCLVSSCFWMALQPTSSRRTDVIWPGVAFRWTIAVLFGIGMPLSMWSLVKAAAKPHKVWSQIDDAMMDADRLTLAVKKFDGSHAVLKEWLDKNRLTLKFVGYAVDETLPGKLLGGLLSIAGGGVLVFLRTSGWG